jgi:hypothetical protein
MWEVALLQHEINAISNSSGVTFMRSKTCDLVRSSNTEVELSSDPPESALRGLCLGRPNRPSPMDLLIIDSASAKAIECSNMDIPVSVITGLPCNAHESVSIKWLKQSSMNVGQSRENDPYGIPGLSPRAIFTALHDCSSDSHPRRVELIE